MAGSDAIRSRSFNRLFRPFRIYTCNFLSPSNPTVMVSMSLSRVWQIWTQLLSIFISLFCPYEWFWYFLISGNKIFHLFQRVIFKHVRSSFGTALKCSKMFSPERFHLIYIWEFQNEKNWEIHIKPPPDVSELILKANSGCQNADFEEQIARITPTKPIKQSPKWCWIVMWFFSEFCPSCP